MTKGKTHIAIVEETENGFVVLESEEKTVREIADFYSYHEALEAEDERLKKENEFLRNLRESSTLRNEQMLTNLIQIFSAIGVYDSQKNTLNLEPVLRPYFEKMLADNLKQQRRRGRLFRRWELVKARAGVGTKSSLLATGYKVFLFLVNKFTAKR